MSTATVQGCLSDIESAPLAGGDEDELRRQRHAPVKGPLLGKHLAEHAQGAG
jgi:hypothetical protein